MTANGFCPKCGNEWRDLEPGDPVRCPKYEMRVTLVTEKEAKEA
jgi:DNA-directed RNA polymerase subunit RPC12/RpoP